MSLPMRVLVTGANGFVATAVIKALIAAGFAVTAAGRTPPHVAVDRFANIAALDGAVDWTEALAECGAVVHLAARTHARDLDSRDALADYTRINVDASIHLAEQAHAAGISRFVFMSSIKVNGESTLAPVAHVPRYDGADRPAPIDNYGMSKWHAEQRLAAIADSAGSDLTILRPPLVFGPGQKGNLAALVAWVAAGRPLPLACVRNLRSLIYVENLADAVVAAVLQHHVGVRTLTLADIDISTPDLVRAIAQALGVPARLWPVPLSALKLLATLSARRPSYARLAGSLLVNVDDAKRVLNWQPAVAFADAIGATVRDHLAQNRCA